mmetsp:Transcript_22215/g.19044  ORF Transcript_22215/g.19044 Transcript_22215/m.19044 type:complete len:99 (+) Transcript_22215:728-1024(+)
MWIVESKNFRDGGYVEWNEPYRFKHLSSGRYLCVREDKRERELTNQQYKICLDREAGDDTLFKFLPVKSTQPKNMQQYVALDTFAIIQHVETSRAING